ncbi:MAG TPA: hypothetical protein VE863_00180 [Pyrinomonadaceae bacterium]|jgi:DUF4097 and DUF4098 domain-containing protein YvlB|nr:hypothetical protein [Pyrinomonadaceae bacterium]
MKRVLIVVALIICAAVLGLWRSHGGVRAGLSRVVNGPGDATTQAAATDEIRKTFDLKAGEKVWIQGINGRVEIQTSDTKTGEVYVKRTGDTADSLQRRQMIVEQNADGLLVRSRQVYNGVWDHLFGKDPKEEVTIKAPRQIALQLRGVNGRVISGDIDGPINLQGLNGNIELGQVGDSIEIHGVNGSIVFGMSKLGDGGAHINGVNGGIELKLGSGLNADLIANGMNGSVKSEIPEVTVTKENWSHYSAQIGKGGGEIQISGVNGNVRLTRGVVAATNQSQPASKSAAEAKRNVSQ